MLRLHELCRVRNASLSPRQAFRGYDVVVIKKVNKASVRVALVVDANYNESPDTFLVRLEDVWKLKAAQRKQLERYQAERKKPVVVVPKSARKPKEC